MKASYGNSPPLTYNAEHAGGTYWLEGQPMRIGFSFPQSDGVIGADLGGVRSLVEAAESLGYEHLNIVDHVLGANAASRPGWRGPYNHTHYLHEPLVLFGYLAAITRRLVLATGILILPQRQTALVAKQAAEVDVLSGGRLRLGIGIGWNDVEYEALISVFQSRQTLPSGWPA